MVKSINTFWGCTKLNFVKKADSFKIKSNMELNSFDRKVIEYLINKVFVNFDVDDYSTFLFL